MFFWQEGDLIVGEVREIRHDNVLSLMVRDVGQGKLGQGLLIKVPSSLIVPQKKHTHILPNGVTLILGMVPLPYNRLLSSSAGCNGLVWVGPTRSTNYNFEIDQSIVPLESYEAVCKIGNCVRLLSKRGVPLSEASISYAYETSLESGYSGSDLLKDECIDRIAEVTEIQMGAVQ